jgi:undecaprenyl-diphosphatase
LILLAVGVCYYWLVYLRQIREVTPACFRAPQMNASKLEAQIDTYHLKTILNLRGLCDADWYDDEAAVCKKKGVELRDVKIDPLRLPRPNQLQAVVECFDSAPKPVLIHCRNGVDRTGFAAVLNLVLCENVPIDVAVKREMLWNSGHIRTGSNDAAERFFEFYEESQKDRSTRVSLREWISKDYPALYEKVGPYGSIRGPVRVKKSDAGDSNEE